MIMDANFGMEIQYGIEELWLNPSNLLMISQNIKNAPQKVHISIRNALSVVQIYHYRRIFAIFPPKKSLFRPIFFVFRPP